MGFCFAIELFEFRAQACGEIVAEGNVPSVERARSPPFGCEFETGGGNVRFDPGERLVVTRQAALAQERLHSFEELFWRERLELVRGLDRLVVQGSLFLSS